MRRLLVAVVSMMFLNACAGNVGIPGESGGLQSGATGSIRTPLRKKPAFSPLPGHHYAWVAGGSSISIIDTTTLSEAGMLAPTDLQMCPSPLDGFEAAFNPAGTALFYSSTGGSSFGFVIRIDPSTGNETGVAFAQTFSLGVTVDETGQYLYVTGDTDLQIYDTNTLKQVAALPLMGSVNNYGLPAAATAASGHRAYFGSGDNTIAVVDTNSQTIVHQFSLPTITDPYTAVMQTMAIDPSGATLYIAHSGSDQLVAMNAATGAIKWTTSITRPYGTAVNHAGTLVYVTSIDTGLVNIVDAATGSILHTIKGGGVGVEVSADDSKLYVVSGQFVVDDAMTGQFEASLPVGGFAVGRFLDRPPRKMHHRHLWPRTDPIDR